MYSQQADATLQAADADGRPDRQDVGGAAVQALGGHRARLRLRVRRGAHRRLRTTGRRCPTATGTRATTPGPAARIPDPFWLHENPFLRHYITRNRRGDAAETARRPGTTGAWNAFTGNSAGFQDWDVDLSAYAGKQVEVSITYATDPAHPGPRRLRRRREGPGRRRDRWPRRPSRTTSVAGRCPASPPENGTNSNDWERTASVGFVDGPGRGDRPLAATGASASRA